jgi:hypothetical protein
LFEGSGLTFNRQGIPLTAQRQSGELEQPDAHATHQQRRGQANFVNPDHGLQCGRRRQDHAETEMTINVNYLRFDRLEPWNAAISGRNQT